MIEGSQSNHRRTVTYILELRLRLHTRSDFIRRLRFPLFLFMYKITRIDNDVAPDDVINKEKHSENRKVLTCI